VAGAKKPAPTIAVINASEDIVEMMTMFLTEEGYVVAKGHVPAFRRGETDFIEFLREKDPAVVILDIAPPYEVNWAFYRMAREMVQAKERPFILTTTNKAALDSIVGPTEAIEIIGKPFDLEEIGQAVETALKSGKGRVEKKSPS
jgi:DNA-binding response OmpR family regulator